MPFGSFLKITQLFGRFTSKLILSLNKSANALVMQFSYLVYMSFNKNYSESEFMNCVLFEQLVPLHSPQAVEHSSPVFIHVHLFESQFCLHSHLIMLKSFKEQPGYRSLQVRDCPVLLPNPNMLGQVLIPYESTPTSAVLNVCS